MEMVYFLLHHFFFVHNLKTIGFRSAFLNPFKENCVSENACLFVCSGLPCKHGRALRGTRTDVYEISDCDVIKHMN